MGTHMPWKSTVPDGKSGPWEVSRFTIDEPNIETMRLAFQGRRIPPGTYTRLTCNGSVIMSDTRAEQIDHLGAYNRAGPHCLLNGLGLGVMLESLLAKPGTEHVTVIELSEDVIKLVAPHFDDPRVTIINANAMDWQPPKGARFDMVWHDIWPAICSDNLKDMHRLHRRYGRRARWQGSWARGECERSMRGQG